VVQSVKGPSLIVLSQECRPTHRHVSDDEPDQANPQNPFGPAHWKPAPVRGGMIVAGMRSAEECYRNVRRYSAGVMPVARRNARVKLDCEEKRQSRAISQSDARPVAIIALAFSSRRWLT
jgi:hypothetical protein